MAYFDKINKVMKKIRNILTIPKIKKARPQAPPKLPPKEDRAVKTSVDRAVREYGEAFRKLARE